MRNRLIKLIFSATLLFGVLLSSQAFAEAGFPNPPIGAHSIAEPSIAISEIHENSTMGFPKPPIGN